MESGSNTGDSASGEATPDDRRAIEADMRETREEYGLYLADQYAGNEEWRM